MAKNKANNWFYGEAALLTLLTLAIWLFLFTIRADLEARIASSNLLGSFSGTETVQAKSVRFCMYGNNEEPELYSFLMGEGDDRASFLEEKVYEDGKTNEFYVGVAKTLPNGGGIMFERNYRLASGAEEWTTSNQFDLATFDEQENGRRLIVADGASKYLDGESSIGHVLEVVTVDSDSGLLEACNNLTRSFDNLLKTSF